MVGFSRFRAVFGDRPRLVFGASSCRCCFAGCAGGRAGCSDTGKNNNTRDFLALAKVLVKEVQVRYNIPVIINDRVDIALASGAAGVHLGQSDMPVADARRLMGTRRIIGLTAPTMETLERAVKEEVQYIAVSPVFPTETKKDTAPAWGIEGMRRARAFLDEQNAPYRL